MAAGEAVAPRFYRNVPETLTCDASRQRQGDSHYSQKFHTASHNWGGSCSAGAFETCSEESGAGRPGRGGAADRLDRDLELALARQQPSVLRCHCDQLAFRLGQHAEGTWGSGIGSEEPELVDMVYRNRLRAQAVSSNLVGIAGEADRPDRVVLAVADDSNYRHRGKIRRLAGDYRGDEKGQR